MPDPRPTLGAILERVGTTLIDVVAGVMTGAGEVTAFSIYDSGELGGCGDGAILLGVGVVGTADSDEFIGFAIEQRAAALVLRQPVVASARMLRTASDAGLVVLGLTAGVDWGRLSTALARALEPETVELGGERSPFERLARLANTLGELLGAAITIEDVDAQVLAYSSNQTIADESRKAVILQRSVPRRQTDWLKRNGVYRRIYGSDTPVRVEAGDMLDADIARTVMRVATGTSVLGTIWAARERELDAEELATLARAAGEIAVLLDRTDRAADRETLRRRELLRQLLSGTLDAERAARTLGDEPGHCVIIVDTSSNRGAGERGAATLERLAETFAMHLAGHSRGSLAAEWGGAVVGILPVDPRANDAVVMQLAQRFVERSRHANGLCVVISPIVSRASELRSAYLEALRTVRLLLDRSDGETPLVARTEDWFFEVILGEVRAKLEESWAGFQTPVRRLMAYDREHGTDFVATLQAYLEHSGAVIPAAAAIHVHPNTFRYRLRRLAETSGIDVNDRDSRFHAQLELTLLGDRMRREAPDAFGAVQRAAAS